MSTNKRQVYWGAAIVAVVAFSVVLITKFLASGGATPVTQDPEQVEPSSSLADLDRPAIGLQSEISASKAQLDPHSAPETRSSVSRPTESVVVVVDKFDNPIAGANIGLLGVPQSRLLGVTDGNGARVLDRSILPPLTLVVSAEAYTQELLAFPSELPREIKVVLRSPGVIEGSVVLANGTPAGGGIRVVAFNRQQAQDTVDLALNALSGAVDALSAVTDAVGRYRITSVRPGVYYSLFAGGAGLLSTENTLDVRAGDEDVRIRVSYGYAAAYAFYEQGGARVSTRDLHSPIRIQPEFDSAPVSGAGDLGSAVLAGLPPDLAVKESPLKVRVFGCPDRHERIGPIWINATPPGYRDVHFAIHAVPLGDVLVEQSVPLTRTAAGFGTVRVQLNGSRIEQADAWRGSMGSLALTSANEGGNTRYVRWTSPTEGVVDHVPFGAYEARFLSAPDGTFVWPPQSASAVPLTVNADGAKMEVDTSKSSSLRLEFEHINGSSYAGRVLFYIARGEVKETPRGPEPSIGLVRGGVDFARSPCTLPLIGPGKYVVVFDEPNFRVDGREFAAIDAYPGAAITLVAREHDAAK